MNIPDYMEPQMRDILCDMQRKYERESLWAVILKLTPYKDGNQWCVLYEANLQEGVAAFGNTPADAMCNFESEFQKP